MEQYDASHLTVETTDAETVTQFSSLFQMLDTKRGGW